MAKRHGTREQKRLAKQNAKRRTRRRELARRESPDPTVRLKDADRWPVSAALVPDELWDMGIGHLVVARRMPGGRSACGLFLVDVFCLGVKDATWKILTEGEFKELRKHLEERSRLQDVPPEYFAKLVYRAVDYGQSLGFPPHRDFRHAQRLLAGIDPSLCPDEFEFGQDGRPHYIRGPSESLDKVRAIAAQVEAHGGHTTLMLGSSEVNELDDLETLDENGDEFEDFDEDDEFEDLSSETPNIDDPILPPPRRRWLPWR
jgi:hypothetical protein